MVDRVMDLWERALKAVEAQDFSGVETEIDWVIKQRLLERYMKSTISLMTSALPNSISRITTSVANEDCSICWSVKVSQPASPTMPRCSRRKRCPANDTSQGEETRQTRPRASPGLHR